MARRGAGVRRWRAAEPHLRRRALRHPSRVADSRRRDDLDAQRSQAASLDPLAPTALSRHGTRTRMARRDADHLGGAHAARPLRDRVARVPGARRRAGREARAVRPAGDAGHVRASSRAARHEAPASRPRHVPTRRHHAQRLSRCCSSRSAATTASRHPPSTASSRATRSTSRGARSALSWRPTATAIMGRARRSNAIARATPSFGRGVPRGALHRPPGQEHAGRGRGHGARAHAPDGIAKWGRTSARGRRQGCERGENAPAPSPRPPRRSPDAARPPQDRHGRRDVRPRAVRRRRGLRRRVRPAAAPARTPATRPAPTPATRVHDARAPRRRLERGGDHDRAARARRARARAPRSRPRGRRS